MPAAVREVYAEDHNYRAAVGRMPAAKAPASALRCPEGITGWLPGQVGRAETRQAEGCRCSERHEGYTRKAVRTQPAPLNIRRLPIPALSAGLYHSGAFEGTLSATVWTMICSSPDTTVP
jgi:hypothetical protein